MSTTVLVAAQLAIAVAVLVASVAILWVLQRQVRQQPEPSPAASKPVPGPDPTHRRASDTIDVRVHDPIPPPPIRTDTVFPGQIGTVRDTRDTPAPFAQIGIVFSLDADARYPLYGRPTPHRRHRHQYYIATETAGVQLAARVNGRDCGEELGCDELYDGDEITVPELGPATYTVKLFSR